MKMVKFCAVLSVFLFVQGCYITTGVIETGKDTYSVVEEGRGTLYFNKRGLMKRAYQEANAFCKERNKALQPISTSYRISANTASYELQFRALNTDDPEFRRPTLEAVPDALIEVRQK